MYKIKEIYYTIQGEGFHAGRPAVFCRFSGCNLWSGREEDRSKAICQFCDTNFWGTDGENGGKYSADGLTKKIMSLLPKNAPSPFIVLTGGEPALQVDDKLIDSFHAQNMEVAIETNGTKPLPTGIDWICMSPKAGTEIVLTKGNEIKIVIPQKGINPADFEDLDYDHKYVQAMESDTWDDNIKHAVQYVLEHPHWKLSVQTHKYLGID
ncbi:MAG: 7-carboxy-7-deazaguanine synthase [Saprospiraceae bacterium]|jgi:7-carboxy-7-deazaguanine synthase|tara:strand:+ start:108 stop:734 length:627 start_codon:yes stop_codon:yes gene_type:complete